MKTISISQWVSASVSSTIMKQDFFAGLRRASRERSVFAASTSESRTPPSLGSTWSCVRELKRTEVRAPLLALAMLLFSALATFAQVNRTIGTLPPGGTVTITFDVTINTNFPLNVFSVTNQAVISGTGFSVVTDDPATVVANDSTVTALAPDFDFGDAPAPYPTLLANDGARHIIPFTGAMLYLGALPPDSETNGQPQAHALGDNLNGVNDEDGVILPAGFITGQSTTIAVISSATGKLDAWVDWNRDGSWTNAGDQIFTNQTVVAGTNVLTITVPAISISTNSFARFRLSSAGNLLPTGQAADGEVEDYEVALVATVPPAITCPPALTTNTASGQCFQNVAFSVTVTAGNPAPTVTYTLAGSVITSPFAFAIGTNTVTVTATNGAAPDATCSFTVTVIDNEAPTITAPPAVNVATGPGSTNCATFISDTTLGSPIASDNCSFVVNRTGVPPGNIFPVGTTVLTYTATDGGGNMSAALQNVQVVDNTPPGITAPTNVIVNTGPGATNCTVLVSDQTLGTATVTDNCSASSTRSGIPAGNLFPIGMTAITYTATDVSGNTNVATQTVTVIDDTPPVINCPTNLPVVIEPGETNTVVNFTVSAGDNCSIASTNSTPPSGSTFAVGTNTVTTVATDASGNTNTCSFLIIVNRRPTAGDDTLGAVENGSATASLAKLLANDSDADGDTLTITGVSATSTNGGTLTLNASVIVYTPVNGFTGQDRFTYTITDARGATNTATVVVTVGSADTPSLNQASITPTANGMLIQFAGIPGQYYIVQSADNVNGPWTNLSPAIPAGPTGVIQYEDTTQPPPVTRYYRTIPGSAP